MLPDKQLLYILQFQQKEFEDFTGSKKKGDTAIRRIGSSDFEAREFRKSDAKCFLYEKLIFEDFGAEWITIMDYQDTLADESETQISAENKQTRGSSGCQYL